MLKLRKNNLIVGRAATGIYLIFKVLGIQDKKVLYPVNICYAAIYPAIYAANKAIFCDVSEKDGNLTLKEIERTFQHEKDIAAVVVPHMYGNPVQEIESIAAFCREKSVLCIEDCASAMGAMIGEKQVGSFGDYVLYSTGYAKTIDVGFGGIVSSDNDLTELQRLYKTLSYYSKEVEYNESFFSKLYRLIRNDRNQTLAKHIFGGLTNNMQDMFLFQLKKEQEDIIWERINDLDEIIKIRKKNVSLYNALIKDTEIIQKYQFYEGAVPWRCNLLVDKEERQVLIDYLLERDVPVSDWYPCVNVMFGQEGNYKGAMFMEERLVNFPLLINENEIKRIADTINEFTGRKR